jgi:nitroimidazol reductase NimA-like FMN-containing flavoprotein (pyridoxamine 5'-phosphate oxidase superfamily)
VTTRLKPERLAHEECLRLLGGSDIGRLAVTVNALPMIVPVNFCLDGRGAQVLFRTPQTGRLKSATDGAIVGFEVDGVENGWGWSVHVTGVARPVTDAQELARLADLPLAEWATPTADRVVAISTEIVTGTRVPAPATR